MRLTLHTLCQQITQEIATQQIELEGFYPSLVAMPAQPYGCKWQQVVDFPLCGLKKSECAIVPAYMSV